MAAAGAAGEDRQLVDEELAAAVGEDRREAGEARPVPLAAAGGEPFDAAVVWKHGAADRRAAGADQIGRRGGQANGLKEGGTERCMRTRLKLGTSGFSVRGGGGPGPSWGGRSRSGMERPKKKDLTEAIGCILDAAQDAKMEILARLWLDWIPETA